MLSRRDFGSGLAVSTAARRRSPERSAPPPPAPANEPNLARILRTKKLRIVALPGEEPYCYRDTRGGQWAGLWVAMAGDLAAQLGVELVVAESNWAEAVTDLHIGRADLSYVLAPTAQRAMFADFGRPVFYDTYAVIARKGFAPKSWAEINTPEVLIAVDIGSLREEAARRFAGNAAITGFKTRDEAMQAIQSGRADCFIATVFLALTTLKKNPEIGELVVPAPQLRAEVCPAVPYDDDRRFRGVVDAWSEDKQGAGQIHEFVMAGLGKLGIGPGDLPPDVSF